MAIAAPAAAGFALFVSVLAVQLLPFLGHPRTTTAAQASPLNGAVLQVLLPLAVMETLFAAVAFHRRRPDHIAFSAAAGDRRLSELVAFLLCAAAGILEFFLFVQREGGGEAVGAQQARALGLTSARALPAAAAATFFLGMSLIFVHVCAGGVGGGGGAVAGDDDAPAPEPVVWVLAEMTVDAAAALVCLMAMALYTL
uniref:Uncharacterized protein n=1 Tax=Arundo donax TaxID=35708 RepID=A0A0A9AIK4_ARUDO